MAGAAGAAGAPAGAAGSPAGAAGGGDAGSGAAAWLEANHRWLAAAVSCLEVRLRQRARQLADPAGAGTPDPGDELAAAEAALHAAAANLPAPAALDRLAAAFSLTGFERDLLLLTAADELDVQVGPVCAALTGGRPDGPSFGLALAVLDGPHWSALTPDRPLRRYRLVELGEGRLTGAPLRIDEQVLHHLLGIAQLDRRLRPYLVPVGMPAVRLPESLATTARQVREVWPAPAHPAVPAPPVILYGPEPRDRAAVAAAAAGGRPVYTVAIHELPAAAEEQESFLRLWEREAYLSGAVLVVECPDGGPAERQAVTGLLARTGAPVVLSAADPPVSGAARFEVSRPRREEQRAIWRAILDGAAGPSENGRLARRIDEATMQFDLGYADIADTAYIAAGTGDGSGPPAGPGGEGLWQLCRVRSRSGLDRLAQRVEPRAGWSDLVLPAEQAAILRDIVAHVRGRAKVYHDWGFERVSQRGLGVSALFTGGSGTGKTLAAEVIARELGLDLYCVDLSAVVSKYIGETEKNLRTIFEAADKGGAVLLFDEADALYGKRTEVRDSHDRYANIEVSFLLQRMETYRGLAVLTTNLRTALDPAFLRRLRFVVQFPFPDQRQRADIWRRVFPPEVPTDDLDPVRLGQLNVAGGNIRNIALRAAFLAADAEEPVAMRHVLRAARSEYAKLDRPLTAMETGGWE